MKKIETEADFKASLPKIGRWRKCVKYDNYYEFGEWNIGHLRMGIKLGEKFPHEANILDCCASAKTPEAAIRKVIRKFQREVSAAYEQAKILSNNRQLLQIKKGS